jgi:hypothetical protein
MYGHAEDYIQHQLVDLYCDSIISDSITEINIAIITPTMRRMYKSFHIPIESIDIDMSNSASLPPLPPPNRSQTTRRSANRTPDKPQTHKTNNKKMKPRTTMSSPSETQQRISDTSTHQTGSSTTASNYWHNRHNNDDGTLNTSNTRLTAAAASLNTATTVTTRADFEEYVTLQVTTAIEGICTELATFRSELSQNTSVRPTTTVNTTTSGTTRTDITMQDLLTAINQSRASSEQTANEIRSNLNQERMERETAQ